MYVFYDLLKFLHVMSFVFMTVPLFNLIVVNERALLGPKFNYPADRYMENIIGHGASRCFVFQSTVLLTGLLLLLFGPLGIEALWLNPVVAAKIVLLFVLMGMLSYIHFKVQPKIERLMETVGPDKEVPEDFSAKLKPYRVLRKRMATFCLFLIITIIILGLQTYAPFSPFLTAALIALAALFARHANKTLIRFGWI
ncbi:MAG: hypothetical protein GXO77_13480 [Calditrichaeota bacterium]|nr:hypothetical protein [Calditrichota bacterium]